MDRQRSVLIAEDDPSLANYIKLLLADIGCDVFIEHSGVSAVRRGGELRPDFALPGVVMPEMGGVEAGIKLLKDSPKTKIVLISETVPPEVLSDLKTRGYQFETLPAPFTREELRSVLGI